MHSKSLSMMGLARRAGKLQMGHDMVKQSVTKNKAKLIILCKDASPRLVKEFQSMAQRQKGIKVLVSGITMAEVHFTMITALIGGTLGVLVSRILSKAKA